MDYSETIQAVNKLLNEGRIKRPNMNVAVKSNQTTKSLLVNCSLNSTKIKALFEVVGKFRECDVVRYNEIDEGYQVDKDIDAVIISGSEARIAESSDKAEFEGVSI